jgi:dTDP-4-dehydrorhamnose 3,5-epimerase
MKITPTDLPEILLLEPRVFRDDRGAFFEVWKDPVYRELGIRDPFVQDNVSHSVRGTLRGLHFQEPTAQGKLVQVLDGTVYDVAADVRRGSPTFGRWVGVELDGDSARQLWIPPGFAHGFLVTSARATFLYKCTALYSPAHERSIRWNDPLLAISWPLEGATGWRAPLLSAKDADAPLLLDAEVLPTYQAA